MGTLIFWIMGTYVDILFLDYGHINFWIMGTYMDIIFLNYGHINFLTAEMFWMEYMTPLAAEQLKAQC